MSKIRMSCERADWIQVSDSSLKIVYRGADGELKQWVAPIDGPEQALFARTIIAGLLTIDRDLKKHGIEQTPAPAVTE